MKNVIRKAEYLETDGRFKLVVQTRAPVFDAALRTEGGRVPDAFNRDEPYDRTGHVFPLDEAPRADALRLAYRLTPAGPVHSARFGEPIEKRTADEAFAEADRGWHVVGVKAAQVAPGLVHTWFDIVTRDGAPVRAFLLDADMTRVSLRVGTPDDGRRNRLVRQTVPDMASAAEKKGFSVLAAVNADFFDIFGDCHPAGLCVKDGVPVANTGSDRYFVGTLHGGKPVIASLPEDGTLLSRLEQAAGGLELLLDGGEIADVGLIEPFGMNRHPRTAAGVTDDDHLLLLVVDGRIPDHSAGATLADMALFLQRNGAVRAVNLDGGGSSVMYLRQDGALRLQNRPADLFRPNDCIIREEFDCLLFCEKR